MKHIEYVKVDYKDRRPTTEFPARHGPDDPITGIKQMWFERGEPARYFGLAPNDADLTTPGIIREISEADWAKLIEQRREVRLQELAEHRWRIETGGVILPDGSRILTDRESQAQLTSAYQSLSMPFVESIDWKAADGWVTVTEAELRPIAQAVAQHVQACFKAERYVSEQIAAVEGAEALHGLDISGAFGKELENIKEA
ncbi:DUF4376 domain-containing protein [Vreelandella neptunia]|uniref:DUF4376 domain-containing protein n=1 Tax=Vreelandella neptunia TaxID=115551 RepID=UPI00315AC939